MRISLRVRCAVLAALSGWERNLKYFLKSLFWLACLSASAVSFSAPDPLADGYLARLRYASQQIPRTLQVPRGSAEQVFEETLIAMSARLENPQTKAWFLARARNLTVVHADEMSGAFVPWSEEIVLQVPAAAGGTALVNRLKVHELAHWLHHLEVNAPERKYFSPLSLARSFLYAEDYAYRWEYLYLNALSPGEVEHVLDFLTKMRIGPERAQATYQRIFTNRNLPLARYLFEERESDRHGLRALAEFRARALLGQKLFILAGAGLSCAGLLSLFY